MAPASPDVSEYEQIITLIPGVVAARVVAAADKVAEVHVLADASRHPMQLVRDIESSIMARFGQRIDRRRISVAQMESAPVEQPRLVLGCINLAIAGNEAEVRADMRWRDRKVTGIARGAATTRGRLVLAAQAVLSGVSELLPPGVHFTLETLDTLVLAGEQSVLVLVTMVDKRKVQHLIGAAFVRRDDTEAAGRATLAALNRRFGLFCTA